MGGITNDVTRRLLVPLEFLGEGNRTIKIFQDGSMYPDEPDAVLIDNGRISANCSFEVDLAACGGRYYPV